MSDFQFLGEGGFPTDLGALLSALAGDVRLDQLPPERRARYEEMARREVAAGKKDCECGQAGCLRGQAIRAEYARRQTGQQPIDYTAMAEAFAEAQFRAMRRYDEYLRQQREKDWDRRLLRFVGTLGKDTVNMLARIVVNIVTIPVLVLLGAAEFVFATVDPSRVEHAAAQLATEVVRRFGVPEHIAVQKVWQHMPVGMRWGYSSGRHIRRLIGKVRWSLTDLRYRAEDLVYEVTCWMSDQYHAILAKIHS